MDVLLCSAEPRFTGAEGHSVQVIARTLVKRRARQAADGAVLRRIDLAMPACD